MDFNCTKSAIENFSYVQKKKLLFILDVENGFLDCFAYVMVQVKPVLIQKYKESKSI